MQNLMEVPVELALDATNVFAGLNINDVMPDAAACGGKALVLGIDRSTLVSSTFVGCPDSWLGDLAPNALTRARAGGVVWSVENGMYVTTTAGANAVSLNEQNMARSIASDAMYVYYGHGYDQSPTLRRVNLDGTMAVDLTSTPHGVTDVTMDATTVYYGTQFIPGECCPPEIAIYSVTLPKTGGTATFLASGLQDTLGLSVGGGYVYWLDASPDEEDDELEHHVLRRVPTTGGQPETIVDDAQNPSFFGLDDGYLYWLGLDIDMFVGSTYAIWKMPLAGGESTEVAAGRGRVSALAVDATAIVWARNDHENGQASASVWLLAK